MDDGTRESGPHQTRERPDDEPFACGGVANSEKRPMPFSATMIAMASGSPRSARASSRCVPAARSSSRRGGPPRARVRRRAVTMLALSPGSRRGFPAGSNGPSPDRARRARPSSRRRRRPRRHEREEGAEPPGRTFQGANAAVTTATTRIAAAEMRTAFAGRRSATSESTSTATIARSTESATEVARASSGKNMR